MRTIHKGHSKKARHKVAILSFITILPIAKRTHFDGLHLLPYKIFYHYNKGDGSCQSVKLTVKAVIAIDKKRDAANTTFSTCKASPTHCAWPDSAAPGGCRPPGRPHRAAFTTVQLKYGREIFRPPFRVDGSRCHSMGGVGLALVRRNAQAHGGTILILRSPEDSTKILLLPATGL